MLTNSIKIITYYTTGTPYEQEAKKLSVSLDALGITNHKAIGVPNRRDWQLNVQWRPYVMHREMNLDDCDLLVVDADATFVREPDWDFLTNLDCDIAAHVMDKRFWGQDVSKRNYSLMAGTLFVKNRDIVRELLCLWQIDCKRSLGRVWDMRLLEKILGFDCWTGQVSGSYKFINLPVEYCVIDRTMKGIENPIIRHHQASRRLKGKIG